MQIFRPYFAMLKPVRFHYAASMALGLIYGAAGGFGLPFLLYKVFPRIFGETQPDFWLLVGAVALLPIVFTVRGLSGFGNAYLTTYCGVHVLNRIKFEIYAKLQQLPLAFFQRNRAGDLMARMNGDAVAVQTVVTVVSNDLIKQPVTFIGAIVSLVYMAMQNERLIFILFALGIIPVCIMPVRYIGKKLLARAQQLQRSAGNINSVLHENIAAVREIKAFNLQDRETNRYVGLLDVLARYSLKTMKYNHLLTPLIEVISAAGISIAIIYASTASMSLAEVMPLIAALYMCYDPIKKLGGIQGQIKKGQASVSRIEHILKADDTIPEPEHPRPFEVTRTDIEFRDVVFGYGGQSVLHQISAVIPSGSITALVGPSGAGKSTLVNLIPRFYDAQCGSVLIGGVDVRDYSTHDLRAHIAIVSQDTVLFNDSLRNNIRLGRLDASDEDVEQAARLSFAHDFITAFDEGYETRAGERGLRLSGGQKQRISIARAFLKNAPILILDEATSSLDSESEEMVHRALVELVRGKTVLIIAHRFSTVKMAGTILVMDQGRIRASGSHVELYEKDLLYRSLYDRQFIS